MSKKKKKELKLMRWRKKKEKKRWRSRLFRPSNTSLLSIKRSSMKIPREKGNRALLGPPLPSFNLIPNPWAKPPFSNR